MSEDPPSPILVNARWGLEFGEFTVEGEIVPTPFVVFRGFAQEVVEVEAPQGIPVVQPVPPETGMWGPVGSLDLPIGLNIREEFGNVVYIVEDQTYDYDYYGKANIARFTIEYRLTAVYALVWDEDEGDWVRGPEMSVGGSPDWSTWDPED